MLPFYFNKHADYLCEKYPKFFRLEQMIEEVPLYPNINEWI